MPRDSLIARWDSESFVSDKLRELQACLKGGQNADEADFKGLSLGGDAIHASSKLFRFTGCELSNATFERAKISLPMGSAKLSRVSFVRAKLDGCYMAKSSFENCSSTRLGW